MASKGALQCAPKRRYPSANSAWSDAVRVAAEESDRYLRAYHCPACHGWHIGHTKRGRNGRRRHG